MKKFVLLIVSVMLCFALFGCAGSNWQSTVKDYGGEVSSNGGFLVRKGDYVYFINGVEANTAGNKFGTPVKGAIVRMPVADIGKTSEHVEVVVPKVVYSSQMTAANGIYIFGDYVYYATPSTTQDSNGVVLNNELEYYRTKLDGTDTKMITYTKDLTSPFRFVKVGETVYLILYTSNSDGESVIQIHNAETCKLAHETEAVSGYIFSSDVQSEYAFYTAAIKNEMDENEDYNAVYRLKLDGSEDKQILTGAGKYADSESGVLNAGVTFGLTAYNGSELFLTETSVASTSVVAYYGVETSKLTVDGDKPTAANHDALVLLEKGTVASSVFAASTIYVDLENIIYFDSTNGIMKYDYKNMDDKDFGRVRVAYDSDVLSYTFRFADGNCLYMSDSSGNYYKVDLSEAIDFSTGEIKGGDLKVTRLTYAFTANTSWYLPEIVGDYLIVNVTASPYGSYSYAVDMNATANMTEEELKEYEKDKNTVDCAHLDENMKSLVGVMNEADKGVYDSYYDNLKEDEDDSSSN